MKYAFKSVQERLSETFPKCANRTTGITVLLNCEIQIKSEIVVGI